MCCETEPNLGTVREMDSPALLPDLTSRYSDQADTLNETIWLIDQEQWHRKYVRVVSVTMKSGAQSLSGHKIPWKSEGKDACPGTGIPNYKMHPSVRDC